MRVEKTAYANSFAVVTGFIWTICTLGIALFPSLSKSISSWWLHGLDMSVLGTWQVTFGGFILGGLVLIIFAWISGYLFGSSLEYFSKKN